MTTGDWYTLDCSFKRPRCPGRPRAAMARGGGCWAGTRYAHVWAGMLDGQVLELASRVVEDMLQRNAEL